MSNNRPQVLIACSERVRNGYMPPKELARLEEFADWTWFHSEGGGIYDTSTDPETTAQLAKEMAGVDALVVCHGAPSVGAEVLDAAPRLRFVGELEGDRFAARLDLESMWSRGISTIDTTNGSTYPVAEWALGLTLISMRNAGALFRRIIERNTQDRSLIQPMAGMLTGKRVGLIGGGHMGRRLMKLLRPFDVELWVHDPYLPQELPEALGFLQTSLDNVLSKCNAIICVAPLTPKTQGMIGQRELDLIPSGSVFVNVSRGPIVDSAALIERLKRNDIAAGLDVFDPEPIPEDSEIIGLPNVFLTPHFSGRTGEEYPHFFGFMVDELERFFSGHETWFNLTPRSKANREGQP